MDDEYSCWGEEQAKQEPNICSQPSIRESEDEEGKIAPVPASASAQGATMGRDGQLDLNVLWSQAICQIRK